MGGLRLHHGARILVCDGRKALFLVNEGYPGSERLTVEHKMSQDLPAHTSEMGTDRPGLVQQVRAGNPGSSLEPTDGHRLQEDAFVTKVVEAFARHAGESNAVEVVLVAPPKALAVIRRDANPALLGKAVAQIAADLTHMPVAEICDALTRG